MLRLPDATLMVRLSGEWKSGRQLPQGEEFHRQFDSAEGYGHEEKARRGCYMSSL